MTKSDDYKIIDIYKAEYNKILNADLPCVNIVQSCGLYKHIEKRHPECLKYIERIPEIIQKPDYIGMNPKETNSVEFVKCFDENILVAIKLDINNNYFYIASLYDIKTGKLQRRLNSNRLVKFPLDKINNI